MSTFTALAAIAQERKRQVEVEGWTAEHDDGDGHQKGQLARAAAAYAYYGSLGEIERKSGAQRDSLIHHIIGQLFPVWGTAYGGWRWEWWKPTNRRRDLVKAGALIVAEIERLDRLNSPSPGAYAPPSPASGSGEDEGLVLSP